MTMTHFTGRMQGSDLEPTAVSIAVSGGRFWVSAGQIRLGSYAMERVAVERTSIYRFDLNIDGDHLDFYPDDPSSFSDAVGAVIDLTESSGRFGLKARFEQAPSG